MRVIFSIQHPAHVHLFRNAISELRNEGHAVRVCVREKEVAVELLERYDIPHVVLAGEANSLAQLALIELKYEFRLTRVARRFEPDVMVAMGGVAISRPAKLSGAKCLVFTDTEFATLQNTLAFPFADRICTPECYQGDIGRKQVKYPGYHELAYLHPNRFTPDPDVLAETDLDPEDTFVLLRLVSWQAAHDIGDRGFDDVCDVVERLESTGARVLITSEADLPAGLESRRITVPPHRIHHLMSYANLFIGESATMATESAVLGTPAVFISTSRRGYTDELEQKYGLVFTFSDERRQQRGLQKALSILNDQSTDWEKRRERVLDEKIDTTEFMISQIHEIAGS